MYAALCTNGRYGRGCRSDRHCSTTYSPCNAANVLNVVIHNNGDCVPANCNAGYRGIDCTQGM